MYDEVIMDVLSEKKKNVHAHLLIEAIDIGHGATAAS